MTRRGSLIYYLSAWILGCFFMSLAIWVKGLWSATRMAPGLHDAFEFLFYYFFGLPIGALPALLFAYLLRKIAAILKCKSAWHWAIFGAVLTPPLVGALGNLGPLLGSVAGNGWRALDWFTSGPHIVLVSGWWLAIPAGAATGYFLGRIHRAFDPAQQAAAGANPASA